MDKGYEKTYRLVVPRLKGCNLQEAAQRLGYPLPVNGVLEIDFLKRKYQVSQNGVEFIDKGVEDFNKECTEKSAESFEDKQPDRYVERSLLVYYLTSTGQGAPKPDYLFAQQFIQGKGMWGNGNGLSWQLNPLEKAYEGKLREFQKAMEWLGALPEPDRKEGQHSWTYPIFPKISAWICYYEADDEFPCIIQLKFDSGASRYLDFEPLAFLQGSLAKRILDYLKQ